MLLACDSVLLRHFMWWFEMLLKPGTSCGAYIYVLPSRTDWEGKHLALSAVLCSLQCTQWVCEARTWVQLWLWIYSSKHYSHMYKGSLSPFEKVFQSKAYNKNWQTLWTWSCHTLQVGLWAFFKLPSPKYFWWQSNKFKDVVGPPPFCRFRAEVFLLCFVAESRKKKP